ncbi:Ribonuclease R,exoribonuclease R,Exoribonuclease II,ribonuclease R,RNB domain [Chlamydia serpentis]|uniref:Ribonuclease R n=1 Tax=Chlamydia serpentis TaxID=1967782 RepID=A0A2R8FB36_9CHLA|nr:Ribonuclease R,exoribonuclease R,Exoribonuclease II,ribonuclease R,RNB domain [Chlamydia serpentis]
MRKTYNRSLKNFIPGTLFVHAKKGFGFVSPDNPEEYPFDIFVPARDLRGALDGDHVIVSVHPYARDGQKIKGTVSEVLSRGKSTLVGTITSLITSTSALAYTTMAGSQSLVPIQLLPERTYKIGDRILLGTPPWTDKPDQGASSPLQMLEFIGHISDAKTDFLAIQAEYNLPEEFPPEVIQEASFFSQKHISQALHSRKDLRDLVCFTIDSSTAKDFDDAISLTYDHDNNYILGVHIADVSHYVIPHSQLDKEAAKRCNSTYFPGKVIPMLPSALSDNLCSLKPNVDRLAVSVFMTFTKSGHLSDYQIFRSVIRSKYRMTYNEVDDIIEKKQSHPISKILYEMADLTKKFSDIREERGCIRFVLPSFTMSLDNLQEPTALIENHQTFSHKLVEEFMLKANEVVAYHISHQGVPLPFRSHEPPNDENLLAFQELAKNMGFDITFTPTQEPDYQYLLQTSSAGHPLEQVLHSQFVRSMKTASYSTENKGHYGLKLDYYTHFTSPIRRYIDLIVHRLLFNPLSIDQTHLELIVRACSTKERVSAKAENAFENLKKTRFINKFLKEQPKTIYHAYIITANHEGLFFIVTEFCHEGFIPAAELPKEYSLKKNNLPETLPDKMKPGASLQVTIDSVNLLTQKISWSIVTITEGESKKIKKPSSKRKKTKKRAS